MKSSTWGFRLS